MNLNTYKIALIGEGGVGKTAFLTRHLTGEFKLTYIPTIGSEVSSLKFSTNYGTVTFNMWDCAGQENFKGIREGYYLGADGAIAMFDVTNSHTFNRLESWINLFHTFCPTGEIVVCGNKCDEKDRKVKPTQIQQLISKKYHYFDISAKTNYNFEKPFLSLARRLTGHDDLVFIAQQIEDNIELSAEDAEAIRECMLEY